jgi:hypothetical protein
VTREAPFTDLRRRVTRTWEQVMVAGQEPAPV